MGGKAPHTPATEIDALVTFFILSLAAFTCISKPLCRCAN